MNLEYKIEINYFLKSFVLLLMACLVFACSSKKTITSQVHKPYAYPVFLGSDTAYHNFITENIQYPSQYAKKRESGIVIVNCLYNKDGSLSKICLPYPGDTIFEKEVKKMFVNIPQSISTKEMPTEELYILPIIFIPHDGASNGLVEYPAKFPGGIQELEKYVMEHLKYSLADRLKNKKGRAVVDFIINEKGYPEDIELVESFSPRCDNSILKLIRETPRWIPAVVFTNEKIEAKSLVRIIVNREGDFLKSKSSFQHDCFSFGYIDTSILSDDFLTNFFNNKNKVQYLDPITIEGEEVKYTIEFTKIAR